ncbi:hypothetical protein C1I97_28400 [Streptomyces sp. NTH33]|nr:hypothetical protein C1I97_28400 [Streptomyces sp. NTH33]
MPAGLPACADVGFVWAGPVPVDVHENQHVLGALLIMAMINIGLLMAGAGLADDVPGPLRWATGCWEQRRSRPSGPFPPTAVSDSGGEARNG